MRTATEDVFAGVCECLSLSAVVKLVKQDTGMRTATEHPICKCVCVCVSAVVKLVKQDTGMPTATHLFASVYA
jgi:hypothetical protein